MIDMTDRKLVVTDVIVLIFGVLSLLLVMTFSSPMGKAIRILILVCLLMFIVTITAMSYIPKPDLVSGVNIILPVVFTAVFVAAYLIPATGFSSGGVISDCTALLYAGALFSRFLIGWGLFIEERREFASGEATKKKRKQSIGEIIKSLPELKRNGLMPISLKAAGWVVFAASVILSSIGFING